MDELKEIRAKKMDDMKARMGENGNTEMPSAPVEVTDVSFGDTLSKYPLLVVDCWAPWCGPCRMLSPIIDQLAGEMQGKAVFGKLNTDENPQTATKLGVMAIPSLFIFKNGELVDKLVGVSGKEQLEATVNRHAE